MARRIVNSIAAQWEEMNECSLAAGEEKRREICPYKLMHSAQLHANYSESFILVNRVKCLIGILSSFGARGITGIRIRMHRNATQHKNVVSRQKEPCRETSILSEFSCHKCFRDRGQPHILHFNEAVDKEKSPCFQRIDVRMQMHLECI